MLADDELWYGTETNNLKGLHSMKKVLPVKQAGTPRGGFWRRLPRFRTVNGKLQQLHATRGWKAA